MYIQSRAAQFMVHDLSYWLARCASCAVVDSDCTGGGKWETMFVVCVFVCLIAMV